MKINSSNRVIPLGRNFTQMFQKKVVNKNISKYPEGSISQENKITCFHQTRFFFLI